MVSTVVSALGAGVRPSTAGLPFSWGWLVFLETPENQSFWQFHGFDACDFLTPERPAEATCALPSCHLASPRLLDLRDRPPSRQKGSHPISTSPRRFEGRCTWIYLSPFN